MILVKKLKLVFIGIPYSASTAISDDLFKNYDGKAVLRKHSLFSEFKEISVKEENKYLIFAVKRNPMDIVVSIYEKMKNDSKGNFKNPSLLEKNGGHISKKQQKQYLFIREKKATFQQYFKKFYKSTYTSLLSQSKKDYDRLISFENLSEEYTQFLRELGVKNIHTIHKLNQTKGKNNFVKYYTPEIRKQAISVFSPYMSDFGYKFPEDWGPIRTPLIFKLNYLLKNQIKRIFYPFRKKISRKSVKNSVYGKIQRSN